MGNENWLEFTVYHPFNDVAREEGPLKGDESSQLCLDDHIHSMIVRTKWDQSNENIDISSKFLIRKVQQKQSYRKIKFFLSFGFLPQLKA